MPGVLSARGYELTGSVCRGRTFAGDRKPTAKPGADFVQESLRGAAPVDERDAVQLVPIRMLGEEREQDVGGMLVRCPSGDRALDHLKYHGTQVAAREGLVTQRALERLAQAT